MNQLSFFLRLPDRWEATADSQFVTLTGPGGQTVRFKTRRGDTPPPVWREIAAEAIRAVCPPTAVDMMEEHGGAFAKALAKAYRFADPENRRTLETAFAEMFAKYQATADHDFELKIGGTLFEGVYTPAERN